MANYYDEDDFDDNYVDEKEYDNNWATDTNKGVNTKYVHKDHTESRNQNSNNNYNNKQNNQSQYNSSQKYQQQNPKREYNSNNNNYHRKNDDKDQTKPFNAIFYKPVGLYVDHTTPVSAVRDLIKLIKRYDPDEKFTIRYMLIGNNNDIDVLVLNEIKNIEILIPWKGFADSDSKHYYNSIEHDAMAAAYIPYYQQNIEKSKPLKAFYARLIRFFVGGFKNHSLIKFVFMYTPDGANNYIKPTKETGNARNAVILGNAADVPIINIGSNDYESTLTKFLNI